MKRLILSFIMIISLSLSLSAHASIYGQSVADSDLRDQRTFSSNNYDPSNSEGGLDGFWPSPFSIAWEISHHNDSMMWSYEYTLSVERKDLSHFILELSDGTTQSDIREIRINGNRSDFGDGLEGPSLWGLLSNSGYPTEAEIFGMKFDASEHSITYQFTTSRDPVWGNFYAEGGNHDGVSAYAYNKALAYDGFDSNDKLDFIVRPNGAPPVVPEPVSTVLFLTGGATLGLRQIVKRKRK